MRVAIFGGTFDPIHSAHLVVAHEAARQFQLDQVLFVPNAVPPHKVGRSPFAQRLRMVELACAGHAGFAASNIEQANEKSYSINTIERLLPSGDDWFFLIGADAFAEITTWYRWREVVALVTFIVVSRPGSTYALPEGAHVLPLETLELEVSSTRIRAELARGEMPEELPPAVAEYIRAERLYGF
jgi:nicotinate-nucleotide adenylyltransferase